MFSERTENRGKRKADSKIPLKSGTSSPHWLDIILTSLAGYDSDKDRQRAEGIGLTWHTGIGLTWKVVPISFSII
ncbi:hypothetical protein CEXT_81461 [Caerostris extrusa]|uniref:Uncharacterized protein n=1 Tax=Caerostris extrusa TaxID=172846 RepID=A0AAV4RIY1_CAEEX|nr:hypothetical protein CEXT_81461 [Caerostris extrusa]